MNERMGSWRDYTKSSEKGTTLATLQIDGKERMDDRKHAEVAPVPPLSSSC